MAFLLPSIYFGVTVREKARTRILLHSGSQTVQCLQIMLVIVENWNLQGNGEINQRIFLLCSIMWLWQGVRQIHEEKSLQAIVTRASRIKTLRLILERKKKTHLLILLTSTFLVCILRDQRKENILFLHNVVIKYLYAD